MSVLLVSRTPLEMLHGQKVLVSDESATAVRLMRLMFYHKGISPFFEVRKVHKPTDVDADAALVIGDAALRHNWRRDFDYVWDLGDLWARHANLPFVFAVWAVRKKFAESYPERVSKIIELLHASKRMGLSHLDTVVASAASKLNIDSGVTRKYFENFCFDFNASERAGLEAFFNDLSATGIYKEKVSLCFFNI
jgi:chorismate dehydratase